MDIALPDFALTDQQGRSVRRADLEGKVWVASFFFTSCPVVCPELIERKAKLKDELLAIDDVRFVSVSVDAENDTPEKMTAFAAKHGAAHERWSFLTGEPKKVDELVFSGFKMALQKGGAAPGGGAIAISHAERFAVVDRRAHIRAVFDSDDAGRQALAARVRELVAER